MTPRDRGAPRRLLPLALLPLALLAPPLAACGAAPGREARPGAAAPAPWPFAGTILPEPPAQRRPWVPPAAGLPAPLIRAVDALFRVGLADPRGLSYRRVEIVAATHPDTPGAPVATRAWVLSPDGAGDLPRFGVAWNGLVYPLRSVGPRADVRADVDALLRADAGERAAWERDHPEFPFMRSRQPRGELASLALDGIGPIQVALLARLGEGALAEALWKAWSADAIADPSAEPARSAGDAFVLLAQHALDPLQARAFWAHARGDDALALASLRGLARMVPAARGEARRLGAPADALPALASSDAALLADQERRARAARAPRPQAAAAADPAARVAAAIEALDGLATPLWGRARDTQLAREPLVEALIREGDAAVEPLLAALERDERSTRAAWLGPHHVEMLSVHEILAYALSVLLADYPPAPAPDAPEPQADGEARRREAARLRASWQRWSGVPPAERWARVLADDAAGAGAWILAAERIALPDGGAWRPGVLGILAALVKDGGPPEPRLPALRERRDPSVAALMARRVDALAAAPREACHLAALLGLWDPVEGAPALSAQARRARALAAAQPDDVFVYLPCLAALAVARTRGGDGAALDEYAAWLRGAPPDRVGPHVRAAFAPLGFRPRHPASEAAARALFAPDASPWVARLRQGQLGDVVAGPAVRVPAVLDRVIDTLSDRSRAGTIEVEAGGLAYQIAVDGLDALEADTRGGEIAPSEPDALPARARAPVRACDLVAAQLAAHPGAPAFRLYWNEAARDRAIAALRAFAEALGAPP